MNFAIFLLVLVISFSILLNTENVCNILGFINFVSILAKRLADDCQRHAVHILKALLIMLHFFIDHLVLYAHRVVVVLAETRNVLSTARRKKLS